jgi:hypothetical protein
VLTVFLDRCFSFETFQSFKPFNPFLASSPATAGKDRGRGSNVLNGVQRLNDLNVLNGSKATAWEATRQDYIDTHEVIA